MGLVSSLLVLFAWWLRPGFITALDLKAADAMFYARGVSPAPDDIVIVAVDEKSVNELGRWPWPRTTAAALIRALSPARTVALDIVFSEEESLSADAALAGAISGARNVVLGFFFRNDSTSVPLPEALGQLNGSKISFLEYAGGRAPFSGPVFEGVEPNTPLIGAGAAGFGSFNAAPQADGIYRSANLVFKYGELVYPALPVEALRRYLGGDLMLHIAGYGIDSLSIGPRTVPVDESGVFALNFYGPAGSFVTYPAVDVIMGRIPPDAFRDRLVFVGATEKGIYDIRPTPVDPLMPGVELHATVAGNVLEGRYLVHDTRTIAFDIFLVLLLPLVISVTLSYARRTFVSLGAFALLLFILVAGDFLLFSAMSVRTGVVYPALSLICAYFLGEAYRNLVVERKSRYLRKAFSTYVSSELVSEIIKDPGRLRLGGEKKAVTVLFSDIRGFTGLSERLQPEELVSLLNEYLSPMTSIVLAEGGMLDKYIGDAIMAVFNAPLELPGHPGRACAAALKMTDRLDELNRKWEGSLRGKLIIGVGINTGEAIVGNMGAELRFDYTAIGDTVNLASRLEGMNKLYGTAVIVSESTREAAGGSFEFRELDLVRVKGKEKPVAIYELAGWKGQGEAPVEDFHEGLRLFRARDFVAAGKVFNRLAAEGDGPSMLYAGRCAEYLTSPPPKGWDGVYIAESK
ncbi:MAG: adenylate/guanylate cyclase domain-containing protein [Deltaproteobacteria bacterium]|nr:adenylate/guanylate cyclase domain-containing protein [Deltaproteobacteria bacterium]